MTYETAYRAFIELGQELYPFCEKIEVAGSVRRALITPTLQEKEVKDVEIVALPLTENSGLFDDAPVRSKGFCDVLKSNVSILQGDINTGRYLKLLCQKDIKIDLFLPDKYDFYRQFAIRTGSADFAKNVLASGWRKLGWVGTKDGLRRESECAPASAHTELGVSAQKQVWTCKTAKPTLPPVWNSEKEFFDWLGIEYVEPHNRG